MRNLAALILAASLAMPAFAQQGFPDVPDIDTGTRFKKQVENPQRDEARDLQKRVARCSVYQNKELSRRLLANSDPVSIDFNELGVDPGELMKELDLAHCVTRAMKHSTYRMHMQFQYPTLRALFAEEVYLMDNKEPIALSPGASEFIEARNSGRSLSSRAEVMAKLADCIVYHGLPASDALLRSTIASDAEDEAMEALHPALSQCGLGDAEEVTLDYSMVRQVVADGLWSRSHYDAGQAGEDDDDA